MEEESSLRKKEEEETLFSEAQLIYLKKLVKEEIDKQINSLFSNNTTTSSLTSFPPNLQTRKEVQALMAENETIILKEIEKEDWLMLNVGGKTFRTSRSTLSKVPQSLLFKMFSSNSNFKWEQQKDDEGAFLLDHDPIYFEPILNFLRLKFWVYMVLFCLISLVFFKKI